MKDWLAIALRLEIRERSLKVGLIVGPILMAINQSNLILQGAINLEVLIKIVLTYCVPYCVSTYGAVEAISAGYRVLPDVE